MNSCVEEVKKAEKPLESTAHSQILFPGPEKRTTRNREGLTTHHGHMDKKSGGPWNIFQVIGEQQIPRGLAPLTEKCRTKESVKK